MNKISLLFLLAGIAFTACNNQSTTSSREFYGEAFVNETPVSVAVLFEQISIAEDNVDAIVEGKVVEVCQNKGCWMKLDKGDGSYMHVTFKDYGFFVPMDIAGKTVVMKGYGHMDTMSVKSLRHYAHEAGRTEEEIESITEPEYKLQFEAEGVYIREN